MKDGCRTAAWSLAAATAVVSTYLAATAATESAKPEQQRPKNLLDQLRSSDDFIPGEDSPADIRQKIDKWMTASDAGNRVAFSHFRNYLGGIYTHAHFESMSADLDKLVTPLIPDIDRLVSERAANGSPTAQYWMAHRETDLVLGQIDAWQNPEVVQWYRLSAEQGFGPAQAELGSLLYVFQGPELEPFEVEKWLYRAAKQGEIPATALLFNAVDHDSWKDSYTPRPEILKWLHERADEGNERAQQILRRFKP